MRGVGAAVAVIAVATALTGCGDTGSATGERTTASARPAEKAVKGELTDDAVRGDIRKAASAAGLGRPHLPHTSETTGERNHHVVRGWLRTTLSPTRQAVKPVLTELTARGWRVTGDLPVEEPDAFGWVLEKNCWQMFLATGPGPKGADLAFDASGGSCAGPEPGPSTSVDPNAGPPGRPTPPALRP